jgi:hypothetical protein
VKDYQSLEDIEEIPSGDTSTSTSLPPLPLPVERATWNANSFQTSTVSVQYRNEKTPVDDGFVFQITTKKQDETQTTPPLQLELELFCQPKSANSPSLLTKKTIIINNVDSGLQGVYPVVFDGIQFACVDLGIDTCLLSVERVSANPFPLIISAPNASSAPSTSTSSSPEDLPGYSSGGGGAGAGAGARLSRRFVPIVPQNEKMVMGLLSDSSDKIDQKFLAITGTRRRSSSVDRNAPPALIRQECTALANHLRKGVLNAWEAYKIQLFQRWRKLVFTCRLDMFQKIRAIWINRMLSEPQAPNSKTPAYVLLFFFFFFFFSHADFSLSLSFSRINYYEVAKSLRKSVIQFDDLPVRDNSIDPSRDEAPVLIEVPFSFLTPSLVKIGDSRRFQMDENCVHLIVFVHGLAATRHELRLFRNYLRSVIDYVQDFEFLMVSSIEGLTVTEGIEALGRRIATEVVSEVDTISKRGKTVSKLSFVGHSMGGVIVRAALKNQCMESLLEKLHTFISLSSPHLGTTGSTRLMSSATWVFQKLVNSQSLAELRLRDSPSLTDCFLYKLSENDCEHFFSPLHSIHLFLSPFCTQFTHTHPHYYYNYYYSLRTLCECVASLFRTRRCSSFQLCSN